MIEFNCSFCGKALQVADGYAGKQARCPGCSQVIRVPDVGVAEPVAPPPGGAPYARRPVTGTKGGEAKEGKPSILGEDYTPSPDDPPDEECRYFAILRMACGIGGIISAIFCVVAGGWASTSEGFGLGGAAVLMGLVAAFFCLVSGGAGWVLFSYLGKIAVYLYSIDKRLKQK
ncbi:MAG: hypothetical protein DRI56_13265 [Chloroflexota bacterium]|nr:MAG: hypothetical protein DRI56_13265 [Chloroflexota bacterium]